MSDDLHRTSDEVEALHYSADGSSRAERTAVVREQAVSILIDATPQFVLLCTPEDLEALAAGAAFSQGILASAREIRRVEVSWGDVPMIRVKLRGDRARERGYTEFKDVGELMKAQPHVGDSLRVDPQLLTRMMKEMRSYQVLFEATGAAHAAGVFSGDGQMLAFSEDVARRNAMDKVTGKCLLSGRSMAGCGVALSGRVNFELVNKAARAGIELIAAVSAPTSMAVETAQRCGITLCAFVREGRATVYTHPHRVKS